MKRIAKHLRRRIRRYLIVAFSLVVLLAVVGGAGATSKVEKCKDDGSGGGQMAMILPRLAVATPEDTGRAEIKPCFKDTMIPFLPTLSPIPGLVKKGAEEGFEAVGETILGEVTKKMAEASAWLIEQVYKQVVKASSPDVTTKWFAGEYRTMGQIGAVIAVVMLLVAVMQSLMRADGSVMLKAVFLNVPFAAVVTAAAIGTVQMLLLVSDGLTLMMLQGLGKNTAKFLGNMAKEFYAVTGGDVEVADPALLTVPLFLQLFVSLFMVFAALFIWFEMIVRDAAVYLCLFFFPITTALAVNPRLMRPAKKLAMVLIIAVFAKFLIFATISLAAAFLAKNEQGVTQVLAAVVMFCMAAIAPWGIYKLLPLDDAVDDAGGRARNGWMRLIGGKASQNVRTSTTQSSSVNQTSGLGTRPGPGGPGAGQSGPGRGPGAGPGGGGGAAPRVLGPRAGGGGTPAADGAGKGLAGGATAAAGGAVAGVAAVKSGLSAAQTAAQRAALGLAVPPKSGAGKEVPVVKPQAPEPVNVKRRPPLGSAQKGVIPR